MKHKPSQTPAQRQYRQKLRARKARLYAVLILSFYTGAGPVHGDLRVELQQPH